MKVQTTKKSVMASYAHVVSVSYDVWQELAVTLRLRPVAYTCGVYGHNADVYAIGSVAVTVGNRPFGRSYDRDRLKMWRDVACLAQTDDECQRVINGLAADMRGDEALTEHHTAAARGYVSRKGNGYVESYRGRFGIGVVRHSPRWDSTSYHYKTYYTL